MWQHYVYIHRKSDTGDIFYIGKGTLRRGRYDRAFSTSDRNVRWQRTVSKHGRTVEIIVSCQTDKEAQRMERALIAEQGRSRLVNLTDGGEGHCGFVASPALRRARSKNAQAPRTDAWIASIRRSRHRGGNGGVVKRGDRLPEYWKKAISRGQSGPNNYMRGRVGVLAPNRREVFDTDSHIIYPTVALAASSVKMNMKTLYNMLSGHRSNTTTLGFV